MTLLTTVGFQANNGFKPNDDVIRGNCDFVINLDIKGKPFLRPFQRGKIATNEPLSTTLRTVRDQRI